MIKFPGEDYQFFFRWTGKAGTSAYQDLGITRFWIKTDEDIYFWNRNRKILKGNWEEILDLRAFPSPRNNPQWSPDTAPLLKPNGVVEKVGVWSLGNHDYQNLFDKSAVFGTVIINNDVHQNTYRKNYYNKFAERLRWIFEAQKVFPNTRFLIAGVLNFELAYNFGMDGLISAYVDKQVNTIMNRPDGTYRKYNVMNDYSLEDLMGAWYPLAVKYSDKSVPWLTIKLILETPAYQKEFHSEKNRELGKYGPDDFTDVDYFCGYAFRNSRVLYFPRMTKEKLKYWRKDGTIGSSGKQDDPRQMGTVYTKKFIWDDGVFCDNCSLSYCCLLYRKGGACRVPKTKGSRFAAKFASGDAQDILDGMGSLLERKAIIVDKRLTKMEEEDTAPSKEDVRMMDGLFKDAAQLAKLRDPSLTRPQVAVQVNNNQLESGDGQNSITAMTDREYAQAVREIEAAGVSRDNITQQMVEQYVQTREIVFADQPQIGQGKIRQDYDVTEEQMNSHVESERSNVLDDGDDTIDGELEEDSPEPVYETVEDVF